MTDSEHASALIRAFIAPDRRERYLALLGSAAVVGRGMGAFVSCIPGRLAYYEAEDPGDRWLLERAD